MKLILVLFFLFPSLVLAQTPLECGPNVGLSWNANTEPDIKDYRVWAAGEGSEIYYLVATIVHDPSHIVTLPDGTHTIEGGMAKVADGVTDFYVSARDTNNNESPPSEHLLCNVQLPPHAPTGLTITIQLINP